MKATRERKIEFIEAVGGSGLKGAISEMLARVGEDFLTDEQIDALASMRAGDARSYQHHVIRQRARTTVPVFKPRPGLSDTGVPV